MPGTCKHVTATSVSEQQVGEQPSLGATRGGRGGPARMLPSNGNRQLFV